MEMIKEAFNKGISFLTEPTKSFDSVKKTSFGDAFKYMAILAIITAVLSPPVSSIISALSGVGAFEPVVFVSTMVFGYIAILIGSLIWGLWLHLWVYIFGAKGQIEQTIKTVFYAGTPSYLLGWLPGINIIAGICTLLLTGTGVMRLHGMAGPKTTLAMIIAILIPFVIGAVAFAAFILPLIATIAPMAQLPY
ncbi:MAG: YIP1 family protein [Candidatus Aenigmarchaeota archaeon]|nr:YIP1 family protein [Candidatus Aenigmarchaeota archaeon]